MPEIAARLKATECLSRDLCATLDSVPRWHYEARLLALTAVVLAEYDCILAGIESKGPEVQSVVLGLLDSLQNNLNAIIDELSGGGNG